MSKILVVGANGFIGSHVVSELQDNHTVIPTARKPVNGCQALNALDIDDVFRVVGRCMPDAILNCAGVIVDGEAAKDNVDITLNLLKAAAKFAVDRYIFSSSAQVYGYVECLPVSESAEVGPVTIYGHYKADEERAALDFGARHSISVTAMRIFNGIGPGMNLQLFLPYVYQSLRTGSQEIRINRGDSMRDYVDGRAIGTAYSTAIDHENMGSVCNVGSGKATSNKEVIYALADALGYENYPTIVQLGDRPEPITAIQADISRLTALGWSPRYDLADSAEWIVRESP